MEVENEHCGERRYHRLRYIGTMQPKMLGVQWELKVLVGEDEW